MTESEERSSENTTPKSSFTETESFFQNYTNSVVDHSFYCLPGTIINNEDASPDSLDVTPKLKSLSGGFTCCVPQCYNNIIWKSFS